MAQISTDTAGPLLGVGMPSSRGLGAMMSDLSQLTKPRITLLVTLTAYVGYAMGQSLASLSWRHLVATLAGTALACMGAAVFNQILERDTDALMTRTQRRPLPAGRISLGRAIVLGLALCLAGVCLLAVLVGPWPAALAAFTILSYVLVYTPLKRRTSACTMVGAVPGAMPPVIGFAAARGGLDWAAAVLFAILFLWQLPHFMAIAWMYREEYARAGLPMLPVVDPDGRRTSRHILVTCVALLLVSLAPWALGLSGPAYLAAAVLTGMAFLASGIALIRRRTREQARSLFFVSLLYLPVVYAMLVIDRL